MSPEICSPMKTRSALTHGRHQFSFGAWFQQFQSNENLALSQFGQASFGSINALLGGVVGTRSPTIPRRRK